MHGRALAIDCSEWFGPRIGFRIGHPDNRTVVDPGLYVGVASGHVRGTLLFGGIFREIGYIWKRNWLDLFPVPFAFGTDRLSSLWRNLGGLIM